MKKSKTIFYVFTASAVSLLISTAILTKNTEPEIEELSNKCPENYTKIPEFDVDGDGTKEKRFCLMKYEAKKSKEGLPISKPSKKPWTNITQTKARKKCKALGKRYSLVSNQQWIQTAKIAASKEYNWIKNRKGESALYRGHSDKRPFHALEASSNDSKGYHLTGEKNGSQRRTTYIKKPQDNKNTNNPHETVLWDLAGNIWEWNNNSFTCSEQSCPESPRPTDSSNHEPTEITSPGTHINSMELLRPNTEWNSSKNTGRIHTTGIKAIPNGSTHGFIRGGVWYDKKDAGIFTLHLKQAPNHSSPRVGFRCSYTPTT